MAEPRMHDLVSDQVYVILQALLQGKDHPLFGDAEKLAKEYIKSHQAEMLQRGSDIRGKRVASAA